MVNTRTVRQQSAVVNVKQKTIAGKYEEFLSQNGLSAIFDIFKVRAPSYYTKYYLSIMIPFSLYIKEYF